VPDQSEERLNQAKFLAARAVLPTDYRAAWASGVKPSQVDAWKERDPVFREEYETLFQEARAAARDLMVQALEKAARTLIEALEATKGGIPDWTARIQAAKLILTGLGVLRREDERTVQVGITVRQVLQNLSDEELAAIERIAERFAALPGQNSR